MSADDPARGKTLTINAAPDAIKQAIRQALIPLYDWTLLIDKNDAARFIVEKRVYYGPKGNDTKLIGRFRIDARFELDESPPTVIRYGITATRAPAVFHALLIMGVPLFLTIVLQLMMIGAAGFPVQGIVIVPLLILYAILIGSTVYAFRRFRAEIREMEHFIASIAAEFI